MTTPPVLAVSAIVLDDDDRLLVVERGKPPGEGQWSVPGGKVERGEHIVAAVAREVFEETGLTVEVGALIEVVERIAASYHFVILTHVARITGGTLVAGDDVRAARLVTPEELAALPTTDSLAAVVARGRALLRFPIAKPSSTG
jgi:ADP-ribose pyrophosphatase YjhB (NUDIX family)